MHNFFSANNSQQLRFIGAVFIFPSESASVCLWQTSEASDGNSRNAIAFLISPVSLINQTKLFQNPVKIYIIENLFLYQTVSYQFIIAKPKRDFFLRVIRVA